MLSRFVRISTVVALATLPAAALAQAKFEGAITARIGANEVTYLVKGDKFRMDLGAGVAAYMVHESSTGATMMVMPSQRLYMDASAMAAMSGQAPAAAGRVEVKVPEFKMTGRKETIAGHECEHMLVTADEGGQFDICGAKGLGAFTPMTNPMGGGRRGGGAADSWQRGLSKDFFPLKVQKVGGEVALEVTKIEKKSLDADLFNVPSDYTKMDFGNMMRRP